MTIHYGTATAERVICKTPSGARVGFVTTDPAEGTETLYTLHPITREIRVRTRRIGVDDVDAAGWREGHHIPPGAMYVGRCARPSRSAQVRFEA